LKNGPVTLRRYLLVRTGWAAGVLLAFVSIAYLVAWVAGDFRHQPGYAEFLWTVLHGSLGHTAPTQPPSEPLSVSSLVWHAAAVTLSLLLVTAVFTLLVAVPLALLARRGRAARGSVRTLEFLGASLLPLWTGLMISAYLATHHRQLFTSGYCPLLSAPSGQCHGPVQWAAHLMLPAVTLTIFYAAVYSRMLRHDLRQAERERSARVEGGEEASFVQRDVRRYYGGFYAKRVARDLGFGLGFALFVERIFFLPGLGNMLVASALNEDGGLTAGVLVCGSIIATAASLLVDVVCAVADPRFRSF
jgi:peptide/nickel transport system permease protein